MAKCPKCKTENLNPTKTWKYGIFAVKAYKPTYAKTAKPNTENTTTKTENTASH